MHTYFAAISVVYFRSVRARCDCEKWRHFLAHYFIYLWSMRRGSAQKFPHALKCIFARDTLRPWRENERQNALFSLFRGGASKAESSCTYRSWLRHFCDAGSGLCTGQNLLDQKMSSFSYSKKDKCSIRETGGWGCSHKFWLIVQNTNVFLWRRTIEQTANFFNHVSQMMN